MIDTTVCVEKHTEDDTIQGAVAVLLQKIAHARDGKARRRFGGVAVDAGRVARKGDGRQPQTVRVLQTAAVAGGQQVGRLAARAHRMDDMAGGQAVTVGDLGVAGGAAVERGALLPERRSGGAVDGAVDAAAAQQRVVGGVDDGVDGQLCDVAAVQRQTMGHALGVARPASDVAQLNNSTSIHRVGSSTAYSQSHQFDIMLT